MKTPIRTARAALLMITALAACASTASAAGQQYDPAYGTKLLPTIAGSRYVTATGCQATGNNTFALTGRLSRDPVGGRAFSFERQLTTIAVAKSNGTSKHAWRKVPSDVGEKLVASDWASNGTFAYVHSPVKDTAASKFVLRKFNYNTRRKSKPVTIELPKSERRTTASVNVLNLRGGDVLVVINRYDGEWIYRLTPSGRPANFGAQGVVKLGPLGPAVWYLPPTATTPLFEGYDGSLLVAAPGRPGQPVAGQAIGLLKLSSSGSLVSEFADNGLWTPPSALVEEKPLSGDVTRDAPQTLDIVGGAKDRNDLTVLFATKTSTENGNGALIAAARITQRSGQSYVTKSFDRGGDGGDGGFPDALPFTFAKTTKGYAYASAWSQLSGGNTVATYGAIANVDPTRQQPVTSRRFIVTAPFMANDFAATPDGKYIYACGAIAQSSAKKPWSKYAPALKRFKL